MKILLFADLHMCPRASIINKWGTKYPSRLENCLESVNWLERKAEELGCDYIISLGDFFDKPDLTSETITACQDIQWSWLQHYHLVGNHDASNSSLTFNSANCLSNDNHRVITEPLMLQAGDCDLCFLPYVTECDRKPLNEYFTERTFNPHRIIFSHNDISGIQLGPVMTKTGFSIEEIEANCDLWINGHLHNGQALTPKVINLGNLTGKDFGEDAMRHRHNIAVIDTSTMSIEYIENPYAYNFYKLQIDCDTDILCLEQLKNNAVVSIKCEQSLVEKVKQKIEATDNIIESRIILVKHYEESTEDAQEMDLTVDHLARFIECCKATLESSTLLEEELSEICK
jgi:DNA repair exonuclease SbcCD nuclease subunit